MHKARKLELSFCVSILYIKGIFGALVLADVAANQQVGVC